MKKSFIHTNGVITTAKKYIFITSAKMDLHILQMKIST